jgi:hypothetical protein
MTARIAMTTDTDAYLAGHWAHQSNVPEYANPFLEGDYLFACWRWGWQDAAVIAEALGGTDHKISSV